jgi:drug/metabolite transporter (DMT)-like permease
MSLTVLLALASALAYGLSDFVGGVLSRRTSAWQVAVVGQSSSAVCTGVIALFVTGDPSAADFRWALLAGAGGGMGAAFLYRGFASGRISVVAPVSAVGAALVPVAAGAIGGERPSALVWAGIAAAVPGIWLVSSTPREPGSDAGARESLAAGVLDGVLAGLGFGVLFAALGQIPSSSGWTPLFVCQLVSAPAVILLASTLRVPWVPRGRTVRLAVLMGPLGAAATGLFLLATQHGYLSVAGVLASLYPASTVLLAALLLRESIHRAQGAGLLLCALAITCVAAG